jgi:Ca-activated chloride channel family protein
MVLNPSTGVANAQTELVTVVAIPSQNFVLNGLASTVNVLFNINTADFQEEESKRPPLNVAIVLDRSGSMSGDKLHFAKEALKKVIQNLRHDDVVHLVTYSTDVSVVFENMSPSFYDSIEFKINEIKATNSTNLSGGLQKGVELLKTHKKDGYQARVFLFSDGLANAGITEKPKIFELVQGFLREDHVKIDSFGIGADFDEALMTNIAEYGAGEFFFIADAKSIPDLVSKALYGLAGMIGSQTVLKIRGQDSACLKRVFGHPNLVEGASLGDLHKKNVRKILCEVELSPKEVKDDVVFLTWELSYVPARPPVDQQKGKDETAPPAPEERKVITGTVKISYTVDEKLILETNKEVVSYAVVQAAADMDEEIQKKVESGDKDGALNLQRQQISMLKGVLESDTSGMVKMLLQIAENGEKKLLEMGTTVEMAKHYGHSKYMKMRGSMDYCAKYI